MGRGVLLHRCAIGAPWIGYPHPLLTSCCVRAWQDRSRDCLRASPRSWALWWPTLRDRHDGVRLVGLRGRSEERDHLESAPCSHTCLYSRIRVYAPVLGSTVELAHDLRRSGRPITVHYNMVYAPGRVAIGNIDHNIGYPRVAGWPFWPPVGLVPFCGRFGTH